MKSPENEPKKSGFFAQMLGFVNPHLSLRAETTIRFVQSDRDQFADTPVPSEERLGAFRKGMDTSTDPASDSTGRCPVSIPVVVPTVAASAAPATVRAEWLYPASLDPCLDKDGVGTRDAPTILYFHGGDYWAGSIRSHEAMISRIAGACGARALAVEYSLAPGLRWPHQLAEALSAYAFLVEQCQTSPSNIIIMGDSAGGNLTLVTALGLVLLGGDPGDVKRFSATGLGTPPSTSRKLGLPAGLVLLSPWVNIDIKHEDSRRFATWEEHLATDFLPTVEPESALYFLPPGASDELACHLLVSPAFADAGLLARLPKTMVSYGGGEQLRGQIEWFCESFRAANDGSPDKLVQMSYPGMPHVFHAFGSLIPESEVAIEAMGEFVRGLFSA